ncbi:DUF1345 domain-containing protein [Corynebacterium sp.]|uniref:DUF1345 domain-containing protein n=1 Tax=Corynebacterium sp. TaxID=1720 RepID=UPI0026E0139F|nr:DUF1345 domain-containing protein [Corynebacterium sp.]MDO5511381.1 DUF1345 domain-containing protein [Corynebacterium sp.]
MSATPKHGQSRRYWSSITVAAVVGVVVTTLLMITEVISSDLTSLLLVYYLLTWVVFCLLYLVLTHRHWQQVVVDDLEADEDQKGRLWWGTASGVGHPEWWSVQAGVVSALIVIGASRLTVLDSQLWLPLLGLFTVAGSWGLMVYAFAEKYLNLYLRGEDLDLPADQAPEFGDFLSQSVAVSTMTGIRTRSRITRTAVRSHTLVAFGFNTVIVAMTVSLLFT